MVSPTTVAEASHCTERTRFRLRKHFGISTQFSLSVQELPFFLYTIFAFVLFNGNKIVAYINVLFVISYLLDINWLFFGLEQFKITVIRNTIIKVATACSIFIFVKDRNDLWLYTLIMALGASLSQIYLWMNVHKFVSFCKPEWSEVKKNVKPVIILFIPAIAYSIYKVLAKSCLAPCPT